MPRGRHSDLADLLILTAADRATLEHWTRMTRIPQSLWLRAHIVLAIAARQEPVGQIATRLGVSRRAIYKWVRRFSAAGIPGLVRRNGSPGERAVLERLGHGQAA